MNKSFFLSCSCGSSAWTVRMDKSGMLGFCCLNCEQVIGLGVSPQRVADLIKKLQVID